jgi:hypothetical protein
MDFNPLFALHRHFYNEIEDLVVGGGLAFDQYGSFESKHKPIDICAVEL